MEAEIEEIWEARQELGKILEEIMTFEEELQFFHYIGFYYTPDQIRDLQHTKGLMENRAFDAYEKIEALEEQYDKTLLSAEEA